MTTRKHIMIAALVTHLMNLNLALGNGLSDAILDRNLTKSEVQDDSAQNQANSRESNARNAENQGNTGAAIALATGVSLISIGVPMTLSIDPVTVAAGYDLIAKGGMELAQAAKNGEGASYNHGQKCTLNPGSSECSSQGNSSFSQIEQALNDSEINEALAKTGVNVDDFKSRLANGGFESGADVARALGKDVDPEVMRQAQELSNQKLASAVSDGLAKANELAGNTITADKNSTQASDGSGTGQLSNGVGSQARSLASESAAGSLAQSDNFQKVITPEGRKTEEKNSDQGEGSSRFNSVLSKWFGNHSGDTTEKNLIRQDLAQLGIQLPVKGVSIFAMAHRKYREFGKTRKTGTRVARR